MAGVTIDIPGIGNVEAKNAATEATLREILKVLQRTQKEIGDLGAPGGGGRDAGADEQKEQEERIGLGQRLGRGMGFLTGKIKDVGTQFADLTIKSVNLIDDLANVGDSLTSAARSLNNIPVVGGFLSGVLGAVAQAAESTVGAFQQATSSGATFGGSINEFARSASAAGMVMADFAQLIANNGEALRLLGGTSEEGARRFSQLSKTMRTSPFMTELNNLGFSTKDVNEGMAGYLKYLGQTNKIGNKSNAELAAGSAKYLKEMDLLAKVTGESRKQQEEARQKLLNDAQFQAKVASMGADAGEAFANTINGLPAGLRDVAKDIMVTGTATTEEAQKFTALMPKSAALMQKYAAITEAGGTITREMQQELQNTMAAEGKMAKEQFRTQGMMNKEMSGSFMNVVQASNIQTDAIKKGVKGQQDAKKTTDGQAAALEKSKQALAEFSNSFQMALANSGLLTTLMQAFQGLATFVQQIVVPAFQFIAPILGKIVSVAVSLLIPAFQFLGDIVQKYIMPLLPPAIQLLSDAFTSVGGFIRDSLIPGFLSVYDFLSDNFVPILTGVGAALLAYGGYLAVSKAALIAETVGRAASTAASYLSASSLSAMAAAAWAASKPFLLIGGVGLAIAGIAYLFRKMGGDLEVLGNMLGWVGDSFKQVFLKIKEGFFTLLNKIPGMRGDFDEDLKEIAKEQEEMDEKKKQREADIANRMEANRKAAAAEDAKKAKEREARDKKLANMKFGAEMKGIGAKTAAEKKSIEDKKEAEKPVAIDYSGPEATAKSFFAQQKSPLLGDASAKKVTPESTKQAATAKAEAAKKGIEAEAEAKKTEAKKIESETKETESPTMAPTQESAETLLAQLNTNMSELLRITKANNRVAQKQLNVQESLSGDVFANPVA